MDIIVCVKQVPDPETPPASFRIDPGTNKVIPAQGIAPVISTFDELAVEAALRIKDKHGGKVTAMTLGPESARDVLKHAMAMGADEGIHLLDAAFGDGDGWATAYALAQAIKKVGRYDLVLCGRQAADWDAGQVGLGIAEFLNLPSVTPIKKVEVSDGKLGVERLVADGFEVLEVSPPALLTVSNELGEPRYPTLRGIMMAARKQVTTWNAQDIGVEASQVGARGARTKLLRLFIPIRESKCEIVEGEDVVDAATKLALRLRESKII
ncbi:MAG: electron transfer flavoprotein subunit beta/FixA family protein [Chloroflexi bacterium]|nr:electron transfer flavoprotein subunit beta/FixA family protein [Chloroflexota bacterium]